MLSSLWLLALIIVLLIIASAFFSSAETALTAASDARMRQLASKGNERARTVEALRAEADPEPACSTPSMLALICVEINHRSGVASMA